MKKISFILGTAAALLLATGCASTGASSANGTAEKASVPCINNEVPAGEVELLDSFEEGNYWQAVGDTWDQWGAHNLSLEADLTDEWASDGTTAATWTFDIATPSSSCQACFFCDALLDTDWTGVKYLVCDINNINNEPIQVMVNTQSSGWQWGQCNEATTLGIGVNTNVIFDLTKGYNNGSGIPGPAEMNRAMITVVGTNNGGTILVDNIRLIR